MQLLVIGATGGTGKQLVEQALQRSHFVTAFVRDPSKLAIQNPHLTVITGNILKPDTLLPAVRRQDVVICSLGNGLGKDDHTVSEGTKNLIEAMQETSIQRLLVVSSFGVGDSYAGASLSSKLIVKTLLKNPIADKEIQERAVRESGLDWTIVRPTRLTDDVATGKYTVEEHMDFSAFAPHRPRRRSRLPAQPTRQRCLREQGSDYYGEVALNEYRLLLAPYGAKQRSVGRKRGPYLPPSR